MGAAAEFSHPRTLGYTIVVIIIGRKNALNALHLIRNNTRGRHHRPNDRTTGASGDDFSNSALLALNSPRTADTAAFIAGLLPAAAAKKSAAAD